MNIRYSLLITGAVATLCGCVAMPPADHPAAPADNRYTAETLALESGADPSAQQLSPGDQLASDWWQLFGSPDVDALVRRALAGNRDLAAAAASVEQARAMSEYQRRSDGLQGNLTASAGRQKYGKALFGPLTTIPPFTYFSLGADISDGIDFGNTNTHRIEQRDAQVEYERQQQRAAWLAVTGNAIGELINTASARAQIDATQKLLDVDQQSLDLLAQARAAGAATAMEVASAQSRLASDSALLPPLRQALSLARDRLAVLQGQTPAAATLPETSLTSLRLPHNLPVALPSELAHRRPDILAAEAQLHAATAIVGIAHGGFYPHVTLTASTGLQANEIEDIFHRDSGVFAFGGSFTAPLLNRGALHAQQDAAVQAMHASAARYEQTVLSAFGQVADALQALEHDSAENLARSQAAAASTTETELLRTSREAGNTGILPLLESSRRTQLTELDRLRIRAQQLQDTVQLFVVLGGAAPEQK